MKKFISAVVFSLTTFAYAQNLDLIRKNYQKAVEDKKDIEKALQQEPDHLETIFIRYSVQKESPAFLGYKNNLKDDKNLLSRNIDNISNPFLKDMIIQILKS